MLIVAVFVLWKRQAPPVAPAPGASGGNKAGGFAQRLLPGCNDPFPVAGSSRSLPQWLGAATALSGTRIVNSTGNDRVVDLMTGDQVLMSIAAPAGQTSAVRVPVGNYAWRIRNGAAWCASSGEFVREHRTTITNSLQIVSSSELTIDIETDARSPPGFSLRTSDRPVIGSVAQTAAEPGSQQVVGNLLTLPRAANGHFYAAGEIDGTPVRFMIDTGASGVSIPMTLAQQLGYYQGRTIVSDTANGVVSGYEFSVRRLAVGPFFVENVRVVALPGLGTPLLGMSVLQGFSIQQTTDAMRLAPMR
jgi:clan AA aspartic protease (TIGR02281 family)